MAEHAVPGPVDFILIEFPDGAATTAVADELSTLVNGGIVRLYDVALVRRNGDDISRLDLRDPGVEGLDGFVAFAGAQSGLFDEEDIEVAGKTLESATTGVLLAYENAWAVPFVAAAQQAGGQLVASQRIPAQVLLDALDSLDGAS